MGDIQYDKNLPCLMDYDTAKFLRRATTEELTESIEAAKHDGGAGVILTKDQGTRRCYVEE